MQLLEAAEIAFFELRIIFLQGKNVTRGNLSSNIIRFEMKQISYGTQKLLLGTHDHRGHGSKTKKDLRYYIWSTCEQTAVMLKDKDKGNTNI